MKNEEKVRKALHEYIDSMDAEGMAEFAMDQNFDEEVMISCETCKEKYGECGDGECIERTVKWMEEEADTLESKQAADRYDEGLIDTVELARDMRMPAGQQEQERYEKEIEKRKRWMNCDVLQRDGDYDRCINCEKEECIKRRVLSDVAQREDGRW